MPSVEDGMGISLKLLCGTLQLVWGSVVVNVSVVSRDGRRKVSSQYIYSTTVLVEYEGYDRH